MILRLFLLAALSACPLLGNWTKAQEGHEITTGPEVFYMERSLLSGTKMDGWMQGWRGSYDHIAQNALYWATEAGFAQGPFEGTNSSGARQAADNIEFDLEARVGFCLGPRSGDWLFVPYTGYRYFRGSASFIHPSSPAPTLNDRFHAWVWGLLIRYEACPRVRVSLDIRTHYMFDAENVCKGASVVYPVVTRVMGNHQHWTVQLPIDIAVCRDTPEARLRVMPFYRHRVYAAWEGSPKNFPETTYSSYGCAFMIWYGA